MIPTIRHPEQGKTVETVERSATGRGRKERESRGLLGQQKHSERHANGGPVTHLSEPIDFTTPRMSPQVSGALWEMMTCQCRLSILTNVPLVGMLIMGQWGARAGAVPVGAVGTWEISIPSSRFSCEPKTRLRLMVSGFSFEA